MPLQQEPVTKRKLLSDIARLFDPLGWVAPVIVLAKILIQKLWISGIGWDEEVPYEIKKEWFTYRQELKGLTEFSIPRWLNMKSGDKQVDLHGFCDASKSAYAAVVYARVVNNDGSVYVTLLTAKTNVAPIKTVSVPRLELCGAVLLAKLLSEVSEVMGIGKSNSYYWTDSEIVLAWLNSHPSKWKTFVANRVSEILSISEPQQWNHVQSKSNPADCASRGLYASEFVKFKLWVEGPDFLKNKINLFGKRKAVTTNIEEVKVHVLTDDNFIWDKYSSLTQLVRMVAYLRRPLELRKTKAERRSHQFITAEELRLALDTCIRVCQGQRFEAIILDLQKERSKRKMFKSLNLYLDSVKILRVGGRLERSDLDIDRKNPILIPSDTYFTNLLIADAHHRNLHGGPQLMLNYLSTKYFIHGAKRLVTAYVRKCVTCLRYAASTKPQLMGQLPPARVIPNRPFRSSGVDYAGPIQLRASKGRGHHAYKGYICLFVCMATKAVHIEVVSDLTTTGFLAAFKRFVARRGQCNDIWSDNGTNFQGASKELDTLLRSERSGIAKEIAAALATEVSSLPSPTVADDDDDEDETTQQSRADADDDGRIYKNPRNSPSAQCPRDEEQATLLGQKCLRKCSSDEDCKSKKKKCLCDGACGMSCIKPDRECPELTQPEIGKVTLTGRLFGDKAVYSCPHGYHVVGLQSRSCQADGKWAGQPPACKENIYCLQPPTIEHARHSALPEQATFDLDATVQYNCHTGYVTNGFPRAKCLAIDGQASWYGPDISCEPRSCGEPGDVPHGWVTADCHTFGCRAVVQCGQGFELVGKAERYCQADGAWAPKELPTCVLVTQVQCPPPEAPRHGKAVYTSCAYNSVVSYECKYGYRLVGDATRRCGADKKWSGGQPMCKEINCGHPGQLWNGWLENISSGTGLGASIIFRCQDGMKMEGNGSAICQSDGTWSHPLPMCLAPCVVPHVSQGRVVLVENKTGDNTTQEANTQIVGSSTMVQHGEIIVVDCEKNYEFPSSNAAVTCNNGTWTQIPRCQPARCKKMPKYPRNGMVIAPKTEHGMKARFRCKDGYELKGNPIVVCSFGVWSGDTPKCEEVFCPFPGYIENGKVLLVGNMGLYDYRPYVKKVVNNKQIMYECEKGYVLSEGPPGATCVGGHWSPRELPKCTLYQHPRIRWSRRRRSIPEPETRRRRSTYRQYYNNLRHQPDSSQQYLDHLYDKYNHRTSKPTLRHANFKIMKKFDFEEEMEPPTSAEKNDENFPTAVYTIYNVHGEPVGHRLYSYQPVYEPEEDDIVQHEETSEYENSDEGEDELSHVTVLKGGMFGDHSLSSDTNADNINKLKHEYFERYVDKRRKRFLNKNADETKKGMETSAEEDETDFEFEGSDEKKEMDLELEGDESKIDTVTKLPPETITKARIKRGINNEEFDTNNWTVKPSAGDSELNNEINIDLLKVVPLTAKHNDDDCENSKEMAVISLKPNLEDTYKDYSKEMAVVPLQYNKTNSTEVDNILDKRDKRTSRKTDRLNQTTATIPKTGREGKGGRRQQSSTGEDPETDGKDLAEGGSAQNTTEKGKKGRPKSPCEPIESEPFVNIEIVKYGRDPNNTFSSGTIVRVACGKGYGLNLETNATAKCVRGRWKPEKPKCEILPCHVPSIEYGIYTMAADASHPMTASQVLGSNLQDEKELNETDPVPNGQVVHFSCEYGYNVQGPTNLRCWLGEWAVTSMPECVAAPCELPLLHGATYEAGYRAGLTVAHASSVNIACEPGRSPPATLNCHLGRLQPTVHDFCRPLANLSRPRPTSEYQSGSDIVREDISELEPDIDSTTNTDCGPPARVQGTLIYRDGAEVNSSLGVEGYPHGTEITFRCIASIMGEKTTWKLICEQGNWVGKSFNCEELEAQNEELQNNNSCTFENDELNVVAFYNDMQITEVVDFPAGAMITSRCSDIGKYAMTGSQTRKCIGGSWDGVKPTCFGLNQQMDYAMEKRPTILFRHSQGPIAQTNDGKLLVYPGTVLHMECLWMRRFGNPKWNVTHNNPETDRKYIEGWTTDPGRDSALEYRLSIINAVKEDSGIYRCETPARQSHQVEIIVEDVHCPPLPIRRGLVASGLGTRLGTEIRFHCANGNALLGAHTLMCRASGNWSSPLPVCESVECGEVVHDTPLGEGERRPRVAVVSRGVGGRAAFSCAPGWALRGAPETVCLPAADWAKPFPVCREVSCPALPPPTSGYVLGRAPYRAGDVLQFHCNPEHTLHGRPILVCQDSGRWSDKPPTCAQACTYPGTTISGRMSSVKFYYKIGETITFTCEPGYRLKGAPMLRCLKNRKWSNAIPLCTPNTNYTSSDTVAMFNGDIDAMLSDAPVDILKTRESPAILSPESYKAAVTRAAVSRLLRRGPIENYRNRVYRVNRLLRRDTER